MCAEEGNVEQLNIETLKNNINYTSNVAKGLFTETSERRNKRQQRRSKHLDLSAYTKPYMYLWPCSGSLFSLSAAASSLISKTTVKSFANELTQLARKNITRLKQHQSYIVHGLPSHHSSPLTHKFDAIVKTKIVRYYNKTIVKSYDSAMGGIFTGKTLSVFSSDDQTKPINIDLCPSPFKH